jgi:hypothetical protein
LRFVKGKVMGDVNGDGKADFQIVVDGSDAAVWGEMSGAPYPGTLRLHADDFVL